MDVRVGYKEPGPPTMEPVAAHNMVEGRQSMSSQHELRRSYLYQQQAY